MNVLTPITVTLRDGSPVVVRPVTSEDRDRLARGFSELSETSRYQRFFTPITRLSTKQLDYLTTLDQRNHFAWGVEAANGDGVGIARYVRTGDDMAEVAFTIADQYQGLGLGWILMRALGLVAHANGFRRLEMTMLADNTAMMRLARRAGATFEPPAGGTVRAELAVTPELWADLTDAASWRRLAASTIPVSRPA